MSSTQIPPYVREHAADPELHLVVQLRDDLARSRMREAFWMSLVLHLVFVIALGLSPKYINFGPSVVVATPEQLMSGRELTYLDLPPDQQKLTHRPNTNIMSDKDRLASTRRPTIDRKTLHELTDSRPAPAGAPGAAGPRGASQAAPSPQAAPQQNAAQRGGFAAQAAPQQTAKLEEPNSTRARNVFGQQMSAGSAIEQAARAAAVGRATGMASGGGGGDYGTGMPAHGGSTGSNLDILSDTMGVDFGPYLSRVLHAVRINWYTLIPEEARAPLLKRGKVAIEFSILKNGAVAGMKVIGPSGDVALDRAAWGGITASNPFPPLPGEFRGQFLALRFHFYYNPEKGELQ